MQNVRDVNTSRYQMGQVICVPDDIDTIAAMHCHLDLMPTNPVIAHKLFIV